MSEIAPIEAVIRNEADQLLPVHPIQALPIEGAEKGTSKRDVMLGYLMMVICAGSFAKRSILANSITSPEAFEFHLPPMRLVFLQSMFSSINAGVYVRLYMKPREEIRSLTREQWAVVLLRGFFGALRASLFLTSLSLIPLGDTLGIFFISPLLAMILAQIVIGEATTPLDAVACSVNILAALIVTRSYPSPVGVRENFAEHDRVWGCSLAVGSALAEAVVSIAARKASASVLTMISVLSEGLFGIVVSALGGGYLGPREGQAMWLVILMTIAFGMFAFAWQVSWTRGLKYNGVGRALITLNLYLPFAYLQNWWYKGEQLPWLVLVCSGIIICTSVMGGLQQMPPGKYIRYALRVCTWCLNGGM